MTRRVLTTTESDRQLAAIDVQSGGPAWRESKEGSYRRHLKSLRRRIRKSSEEIGEPRTQLNSKDKSVFKTLIEWKRDQYARTGRYDVLSAEWTYGLLERLNDNTEGLRADMHVLYFGDRLAAVDLGVTDGRTYHSWITAYDPELRSYSPGMQLLEAIIEGSETLNYNIIDLGPGLEGYKHHYSDERFGVASCGFIGANGSAAALSKLYNLAERAGEKSSFSVGKLPGKMRRRYSQVAACDLTMSGRAKAILSAVTNTGSAEN